MKSTIIKAGLFCSMLALASCGGGADTATTTTPSANSNAAAANTVVTANIGTITVTVNDNYGFPYQGAIVSIGNTGQITSTTNATGQAVFKGLTAGKTDVHVFDTASKSAESIFGVNSNAISFNLGNVDTKSGSWIDVNMSIVNSLLVNNVAVQQTYAFKTSTNTYKGAVTANGVSFQITDKKPGTALTGELLAWQGSALSTSNNTASGGADEVVNLGTQTFTTTAMSTASANSFTATFSATPITTPANLVTIASATAPAGLSMVQISAGDATINPPTTGFVIPDTIQSADSKNYNLQAVARNASGDSWVSLSSFTTGGSVTITTQFTSLLVAQSPQSGNMLAWTNASSNTSILGTIVTLDDATTGTTLWNITIPTGASSVTLPTIPQTATNPLTVGTAYTLGFGNYIFSGVSYEQVAAAGTASLTNGEVMMLQGGSFTR